MNFRLAAETLGVTQSAVAQQVRGLEARLGQPLFHRGARGLAFTEAGRRFHRQIEEAFALLDKATREVTGTPVKVRLATTPELAARWLLPRLATLTEDLPGVAAEVVVSGSPDPGVDLCLAPVAPPCDPQIEATRLFPGEWVAVCAPRALSPRRSGDDAILLHAPGSDWTGFLGLDGPLPARQCPDLLHAIDAALAGHGVALVPRPLVQDDLARGRLVQPVTARLAKGPDVHLLVSRASATALTLRDWLMAQAEQAPARPFAPPYPTGQG